MSFETDYPNLSFILDEIFESVGDIKLALKDGDLDPAELVAAIPDPAVQDYLRKLLTALQGLPAEMKAVADGGPWKMMTVFQSLIPKVMKLFK